MSVKLKKITPNSVQQTVGYLLLSALKKIQSLKHFGHFFIPYLLLFHGILILEQSQGSYFNSGYKLCHQEFVPIQAKSLLPWIIVGKALMSSLEFLILLARNGQIKLAGMSAKLTRLKCKIHRHW